MWFAIESEVLSLLSLTKDCRSQKPLDFFRNKELAPRPVLRQVQNCIRYILETSAYPRVVTEPLGDK